MATSKPVKYVPKNIRDGETITEARKYIADNKYPRGQVFVRVSTFKHGRDTCGNGTAHYSVSLVLVTDERQHSVLNIVSSGARREQVGYNSAINEAAAYALNKLGYEIDTNGKHIDRWYDSVEYYPITNFYEESEND